MSFIQLNSLHDLVPVAGVADVILSATGTAARLTDGVTLNANAHIIVVQPQGGDLRYTVDGTNPTTSAGFICLSGGVLQMHVGSASAFRYCGSGSYTPTVIVSQQQYASSSVRRAADLSVSMESRTFKSIFDWILRKRQLDPSTWIAAATAAEKQNVADSIADAVTAIWTKAYWPSLTVTEARELDDSLDYAFIPYAETSYINIGDVQAVHSADPRDSASGAIPLVFTLDSEGIRLPDWVTTPYVTHRIRAHQFTFTAYAGGTSYAAGDVVYYDTTGECYRRLSSGSGVSPADTATWEIQRVPALFEPYVKFQALADLLASHKPESAATWEGKADKALFDAIQRLPANSTFQQAHVRTS